MRHGILIPIIVASGCATTPVKPSGLKAAMMQAKKQCLRLQKTELKTPIKTDIRQGLDRIQQAVSAKRSATAQARAESLAFRCENEAKARENLASISREVEGKKQQIQPAAYDRFLALINGGSYSEAIVCGEGLLQNQADKCGAADTVSAQGRLRRPVAQPIPVTRSKVRFEDFSELKDFSDDFPSEGRVEAVDVDEETDLRAEMTYARENRLSLSISFGFGTASMGGVHDLAEDVRTSFAARNPGSDLSGAPRSGLQINGELALRYYFKYHLLAQLGYSTLYNTASSSFDLGDGTLSNANLAMELPLLLGGYLTLMDRMYLYGAVGPSILVMSRSSWSSDPGGAPNFETDPSVGAHFLMGGELMLIDRLALGLELRYRMLGAGELKDTEDGETVLSGEVLGDGSDRTYDADLSGISLGVHLRLFIL